VLIDSALEGPYYGVQSLILRSSGHLAILRQMGKSERAKIIQALESFSFKKKDYDSFIEILTSSAFRS
jgi:hypothetical protein